ncbi:MAG: RNA methyltransferase [Candidatus Cloacimonetes bacterium]|jgi:tRNA G18 (ribose-2'-O)-methylase SpoU|nr:RNA methyltransferase [Candidatus Cloacimonadota bacterium]MDD2422936.1 RNA methyltransferase [Candidatus Cloacimonadota bacterium]MDD3562637.1 RNA methyltransferase [Candidatus Cloacimonadota bacterium]MDD4276394.1 RNA methyltransferase [Candidatus Cloacimonadota bacterium]MDY0325266.1 RNA methyltransferase [Candidatus Cloacimonadaceae bacterium]
MKFIGRYSPEKFQNFSFDAQIKALNKLLTELESELANPISRQSLIQQLQELYPLCKKALPPRMDSLIRDLPTDPFRLLRALAQYQGDKTFKDSQIQLKTGDGNARPDPDALKRAAQITVIADNLRSVFNVGSLFRIAECLSIGKLILCGISPTPQHPNMAKTALGTSERVPFSYRESTIDAVMELKNAGHRIYALETAEPSQSVYKTEFDLPLALVVGNEALGIDPQVLSLCDEIVYLPVLGWKNSLNVSVAASVALYQIMFGGNYAS